MCYKKLEEFYPKNIDELLTNSYNIVDINKFARKNNPVSIDSLEKELPQLDLKKINSFSGLKKEYSYSCQEEEFTKLIKDLSCEICEEKVVDHDDYVELACMNDELKKVIADSNEVILKEIVGNNLSVLKTLKKHFSEIIPFLGAGISIPVGMPSWPRIIEEMSKDSTRIDRINDHLKQGEYLDCFPILYDSSPVFKNKSGIKTFFSDTFWRKNYVFKDSNHRDFLDVEFPMIVTTNYDGVLEEVDENEYMSENFLDITDLHELKKNKTIVHLHGSSNPLMKDTMIIDKEDYQKIYNKEVQKRRLQTLLGTQRILFFGYSLDDYYFINELTEISKANNSYNEYYAIMINQDIKKLESKSSLLKQIKYINLNIETKITEEREDGFSRDISRSGDDVNNEIIVKIRFLLYYLRNKLYINEKNL